MARAKRKDKTAFMRYDKLIIDGEEYKPPVNQKKTILSRGQIIETLVMTRGTPGTVSKSCHGTFKV